MRSLSPAPAAASW